ncbi:MAG: family 43 glycosylhydrolase [Paludibacter sp.]|nr:family 43 glycosylhydrolase [Paludibacter sp.]
MKKTGTIIMAMAMVMSINSQTKIVKGQISEYNISVEKTRQITGIVTDDSGKPITSVRVMIKDGVGSGITNLMGKYSIEVGSNDKSLVFYYPGMSIVEMPISLTNLTLNCVLKKDTSDHSLPKHTAQKTTWYDPNNDHPGSFCNPLNIDYNFEPYNQANKISCRSTADPLIVPYKGEYYLFSTNQDGFYVSKDLSKWKYVFSGFQRKPTDDDQCAPAVVVLGDTIIMIGSTYKQLPVWYTVKPKEGRWKRLTETAILPHWDPDLFLDDDGKLYLYYGSSNEFPIKVVEYDRSTFRPKTIVHDLFGLEPDKHGWERFGMNNDDSLSLKPFIEGAFMTKHLNRYYLQYGAPGTEFKVYADGVYVADNPLGPFVYQQHNPFSYKPGGFVLGAGHGGTFKDNFDNYWHIATCMLSLRETFERRIGLYPAGFDKDGVMYSNTAFGDYPVSIPQGTEDHLKGNFKDWMLLSLNKKVWASSSDSIYTPEKAADENMRTYWAAKTGLAGEWFAMDLGATEEVNAIQLNYYEHKANQFGKAMDIYHQYKIYSSTDGKSWDLLVDKSDNDQDVPHDYIELIQPLQTRYLKIENIHTASGNFALMDLRVFGKANGIPPKTVDMLTINRNKTDNRNVNISWKTQPDAYGYNIYFGTKADKLYSCITVYNDSSYYLRGLDKGVSYYFCIETLGETGVSNKSKIVFVK